MVYSNKQSLFSYTMSIAKRMINQQAQQGRVITRASALPSNHFVLTFTIMSSVFQNKFVCDEQINKYSFELIILLCLNFQH